MNGVQSQVASYQRLLKWYLIPLCLTLSNIRYVLRVKWSNPGKGVAPSPTPRCSSYWKGSLLVALDLLIYTCCIAMIQLYVTYTCGNIINNNDERTHFFRKIYLSHFIRKGYERVAKGLCMRGELETEQTATYWPPVPLSLAALLSHSAGCSIGGPEGPALCWELVLTALNCNSNFNCNWLQLTQLSVAPGYIIFWRTPASRERRICTEFNPSTVKVISWYLRPDAPVSRLTAGSKVNMLHTHISVRMCA